MIDLRSILSRRTATTTRFSTGGGKQPNTNGDIKLLTIRSGRPGHNLVSISQMAPPERGSTHLITAYYSIYRPRKDERVSWPTWLTCSGRFTRISGHPTAAGRAEDRERSSAKYLRSSTVLSNQPSFAYRFRSFGSLSGQNLPFSYAQRYGLHNRLGLLPNR